MPRRNHHRWGAWRPARGAVLSVAGRDGPDHRVTLHLGRSGLPGRRSGARVAGRHRARDVLADHGCPGDGGLRDPVPYRGDHPGDRVGARARWGAAPGPRARTRGGHPGEPLRARRQGRRHRRSLVRADVSALEDLFARTRAEGRAALVGYLPAGFPSVDGAIEALLAMVDAGVDAVEIGIPYSDPLMDGPTVQAAAEQALASGTRMADVLRTVTAGAAPGAPTLVRTYWNPIARYGVDAFARDFAAAGGTGVITPDLIPDEAAEWLDATGAAKVDPVFLVAPSSSAERIARVTSVGRGFIYAASTMGVTGAREQTSSLAPALVARVRAVSDLPVCVGLGVSTGAQAAEVAGYADGVIVGSALVSRLLDASSPSEGLAGLCSLVRELADGVRTRS